MLARNLKLIQVLHLSGFHLLGTFLDLTANIRTDRKGLLGTNARIVCYSKNKKRVSSNWTSPVRLQSSCRSRRRCRSSCTCRRRRIWSPSRWSRVPWRPRRRRPECLLRHTPFPKRRSQPAVNGGDCGFRNGSTTFGRKTFGPRSLELVNGTTRLIL